MSKAVLTDDEKKKKNNLKALAHFHKSGSTWSCPPFATARVKVQLFFTNLKEFPGFLLC